MAQNQMSKKPQNQNKKSLTSFKQDEKIIVKGARTHNLKNINVEMPRNAMIAITGLSGSGKSSLAFDTIFAEGQRRYVESLSSYARQFLRQMQKPDVDEIIGLSPAISIDQKSRSNNPRSTVATITEIYDYLRVLFARIGRPHCLICDSPIQKLSVDEIKELALLEIDSRATNNKSRFIEIFAPLVRGRKGEYYQLLYDLLSKGYSEALVDGKRYRLREQIVLDKNKKHEIDVLVDRIALNDFKENKKNFNERLGESIEKALEESEGLIRVTFSSVPSISVNSSDSSDKLKSKIESVSMNPSLINTDSEFIMSSKLACPKDGYSYPEIEPRLFSFNSPYGACSVCHGLGTESFFTDDNCKACNGKRLREEALHVLIGGKNIVDVTDMAISDAKKFFDNLEMTDTEKNISAVVIREIEDRLKFMINVGIEYLELSRRAYTLSGGEAQRIRLASQLGSGLVGALYVLDEPTIGLHSRDNDRLIKTLTDLRDVGNTIIVVEHDEDTIFASDYIIDIGPKAGVHGGEVVVSGYLDKLLTEKNNSSGSVTLDYLRGDKVIELPRKRRDKTNGKLSVKGGKIFNLKNVDAEIPLGKFIAITGVSGSGKSTFMYEVIYKNLSSWLERRGNVEEFSNCSDFKGMENVGRVILVDQSSIGRTPRSNPATYTGAWTHIRDLLASTIEAKTRGWKSNRFSFNVKGGRCEACQGNGEIAVEMHFLPTVYVPCEVCGGKRFTKDTLEIKYKKKNVFEILEMTVEEALDFFNDIPAVYDRLKTLDEVGLGYLRLGQSATTLSGGEAQRVKISSELYRAHLQKTVYLLDEPTIGLHYEDVKKLIEILQKLVDKGNTVMTIEHNMDFIKSVDYILDFGPEGGIGGGNIVARGTPEDVANNSKSYTGQYLKKVLKR